MHALPAKGAQSKQGLIKTSQHRSLIVPRYLSNLTFGAGGKDAQGNAIPGWGYYEVSTPCRDCILMLRWIDQITYLQTIAGGSGAGPSWHGTDGVHTHITNTRIGDVEIMERRYPVIIRQFGMREGSAGVGKWRGGKGVVRELELLEAMQVSIMSEVRILFWTM